MTMANPVFLPPLVSPIECSENIGKMHGVFDNFEEQIIADSLGKKTRIQITTETAVLPLFKKTTKKPLLVFSWPCLNAI